MIDNSRLKKFNWDTWQNLKVKKIKVSEPTRKGDTQVNYEMSQKLLKKAKIDHIRHLG
jgi:hypothetical protein